MHARALGAAVARMQRRELDRDARAFVDAAAGGRLADRVDRLLVGGEVALRIARPSPRPRPACRRNSVKPSASRRRACASASSIVSPVTNCSPIRRIAMSTPRRISGSPLRATTRVSALASPRSVCVDTSLPVSSRPQVAALTNSDRLRPTCDSQSRIADLVADQRVARGRVRNAQQRLGQAHQRHAFLRRQREFLHQALHEPFAPDADLARAQPARQRTRQRMRRRRLALRQPRRIDQRGNALAARADALRP